MVAHYKILRKLNRYFDDEGVDDLRAEDFAPSMTLDLGFLVDEDDPELRDAIAAYVAGIPPTIRDGLRGVMYRALTAMPRRTIVFALAPAYDYELTIWDMACGITVLYRGRYPGDDPAAAAGR
jgi:hypothetical protein